MNAMPYFVTAAIFLGFALAVFRVLVRREYRIRGHLRLRTSLCQLLVFVIWVWFGYRQMPSSWPASESHLLWKAIGWPLFAGGFLAMFLAVLHMMILAEEEHLTRSLGDEYLEYRRRVPRYLWKLGGTGRLVD